MLPGISRRRIPPIAPCLAETRANLKQIGHMPSAPSLVATTRRK